MRAFPGPDVPRKNVVPSTFIPLAISRILQVIRSEDRGGLL